MNSKQSRIIEITSVVVDDRLELSLEDLSKACQVDEAVIVAYVDEGIVTPRVRNARSWQFSGVMLPRLARALRLQRDFELNTAGVAFALDLLGEIEGLRKRLNRLQTEEEVIHE